MIESLRASLTENMSFLALLALFLLWRIGGYLKGIHFNLEISRGVLEAAPWRIAALERGRAIAEDRREERASDMVRLGLDPEKIEDLERYREHQKAVLARADASAVESKATPR